MRVCTSACNQGTTQAQTPASAAPSACIVVLSWMRTRILFAHKKYSRSFIILRLNHWCQWTILTMSLLPFWALKMIVALLSMEGQKALGFHQKYLNLCSEDERRSYGFGTTWGWIINDRFFIFRWTIALNVSLVINVVFLKNRKWTQKSTELKNVITTITYRLFSLLNQQNPAGPTILPISSTGSPGNTNIKPAS